MTFVIMPASGISQGIQPLVGYNYSHSNHARVKEFFFKATAFSVGITSLIWVIATLFPAAIIRLFGGSGELLMLGVPALRYNFMLAPVLGFIMLATTFFQSIDQPVASSIITAIMQIVVLVPLIYLLPRALGMTGIFWRNQSATSLLLFYPFF